MHGRTQIHVHESGMLNVEISYIGHGQQLSVLDLIAMHITHILKRSINLISLLTLNISDKPDKPVNVEIVSGRCRQESADIRWDKGASNNAPVQYFVVEYSTTYEPDKWTYSQKVTATVTTARVPLLPYVTYRHVFTLYSMIHNLHLSIYSE